MHQLPELIAEGLNIKRPVWVSDVIFDEDNYKWILKSLKNNLGSFDIVIIAHNGKCADRLVSKVESAKYVHDRLKVNFGPRLPKISSMTKMQLCSLWVGTFIINKDTVMNFGDAISVENSNILSWICCTSRKIEQLDTNYES